MKIASCALAGRAGHEAGRALLAAGLILNVWLGLGVWDYSALPGNLWGQICPEYAVLWVPLSAAAIVVDDWLRYWIWGEERPHYTL